jgi:phosphatidylserine/phosphatidylglycerophosphate/cardiolipin synthase-like enzyme
MALFRTRNIRSHHIMGAGAIATLLGIYHFASDNGLLGLVGRQRMPTASEIENTLGTIAKNAASQYGNNYEGVPTGLPTSFHGNANNNTYGAPQPANPQQSFLPQGYEQGYQQPGYPQPSNTYTATGDIQVYFSPDGGCTDAIVREINQAQQQILIQAYSFTSKPIAAACVAARQRNVAVYAILDKSQESEQYTEADFLANSGVTTLIDAKHQIAHNKIILIDGHTVITGSFNFSSSAEKSNAENLLIIRGRPDLYTAYENNLRHHYEHSTPYVGRGYRQPANQHR